MTDEKADGLSTEQAVKILSLDAGAVLYDRDGDAWRRLPNGTFELNIHALVNRSWCPAHAPQACLAPWTRKAPE